MPEDTQQIENLEKKAKEILETDKLPEKISTAKVQKKPSILANLFDSKHFRIFLTIVLMFVLFATTYLIAYLSNKIKSSIPTNFDECAKLKNSVIQESYPAVCVTKKGQKFIQEIPEEERILLESDLHQSKVQGIETNATCLEAEQKMLEEISECEEIDEKTCQQLKQEFDNCMLTCQKDLEEKMCLKICKPVCEFYEPTTN